ncbi:MAG: hypothetical protein ACXVCQ_19155, partial [Bacteriovorax sp.]
MKKLASICLFLSLFSLGYGTLFADDADVLAQDFDSEQMIDRGMENPLSYRVSGHGDWIQRSKINKRKFHHQYVNFYTVTAQAESTVYYNRECEEGINLGVGYTAMRFDWNKNPYFKTKDMGQVTFSLTGFSERLVGWRWQTQLNAY